MPTVEQLAVAAEEAILDKLEALEDAEVQALLRPARSAGIPAGN
jgi:hypothetical protein